MVKPWRRALREEHALPFSVFGPLLLLPLWRLASRCSAVLGFLPPSGGESMNRNALLRAADACWRYSADRADVHPSRLRPGGEARPHADTATRETAEIEWLM